MESAARNGENETQREYNDLSRGIIEPEDIYQGRVASPFFEFASCLADKLYESGKIVLIEESPIAIAEYSEVHFVLYGQARDDWRAGLVDQAIKELKEYLQKSAAQLQRRDETYPRQLEGILYEYRTNVLAIRGIFHSLTLPSILRERGISFEMYSSETYCSTFEDEILMKIIGGEAISDEDALRIHIEEDLLSKYPWAERHSYNARRNARESVEHLTSEEVWKRANRQQ